MASESVTVLFTDMVDSTAIVTSMAPEDADELRRRHFAILRRAIAETEGEEVKNLGDGLMVIFRSASAALRCAVEMQRGVELDSRSRDRPIGMRAGLSGGEVTVEEGDFFGDPVVEAARLCALCEGGQILVTDVVRLTAGRRNQHDCVALGAQQLKGLPYPVETFEVTWHPLAEVASDRPKLPPRLTRPPDAGFVSRVNELDLIGDAYKRVAADEGCEVILVSGEAGLGKTTVVAEAARRAYDKGALVLFGRAEEHVSAPYKLFSEALTFLVTQASEEQLQEDVGDQARELARLVPAISARMPGLPGTSASDADAERYLLFAAVVATFVELSGDRPIVLVVDDLQWADQSALQLLVHLVTSQQPLRLLVLGTFRDDELDTSHPLTEALVALGRHQGVHRVHLAGLDETGVESLLALGTAGDSADGPGSLARLLFQETDGNPFFVTELVRHLADSGEIVADPIVGWTVRDDPTQLSMPTSLHEVIGLRVARLGPDGEALLRTASVVGRDFDVGVLALATSTAEDELLDCLDRAAAAALVYEVREVPGRFRFRHALIQHTLYDAIGSTRRAGLHRAVAEALEAFHEGRLDRQVGELARHWSKTGRREDLSKAVAYARQAGDAALEGLAPDLALDFYGQAIALREEEGGGEPDLDLDLAIGLGIAQRMSGQPDFRRTLLEASRRALDLGDDHRLLTAEMANSRGWSSVIGAVDDERVEVLESTVDRMAQGSTDRALVLAALCKELSWGSAFERRKSLGDEAGSIAVTTADDALAVRVLNDLALPLSVPHLLADSLARTEEALWRAERIGDPVLHFFAAVWRAQTLGLAGDLAGRDRCTDTGRELADGLAEPNLLWSDLNNRAVCAMSRGDLDRSDELSRAALELGLESGQPDANLYYSIEQMVVALQRGILGELSELIEITVSTEMPELAGVGGAALALSHLEGDRPDVAKRLLGEFAATGYALPIDHGWITAVVDYADIAVELRLPQHAAPLRELLQPFEGLFACSGTSVQGPVAHYLAGLAMVLGDFEEADRLFARADAFNEACGGRFFTARTQLWWGQLAAERTDRRDRSLARQRLTASYELATAEGYEKVASRAETALGSLS